MPAFFKRLIPSSSRYFSPYTTLFIPAWIISFEHSIQGEAVTYNVAFSLLLLLLASFVMAFASACSTYDFVTLFSSSHWFSKPLGVPLYPSLIIICFSRRELRPFVFDSNYFLPIFLPCAGTACQDSFVCCLSIPLRFNNASIVGSWPLNLL